MAKVCPKCGTSTDQDNSQFCKKCGTRLPADVSELKTTNRSFKYSNLFALVIYSDLFLCFLFCIGTIGSYLDVSSGNYLNPSVLYFFLIFPANFILDLLLLKNNRNTPNSIDSRICWIKGLVGVAGILTIFSGLYFIIVSVKMENAYKARIIRTSQDIRIENNKEATSGNPLLCSTCGEAIKLNSVYCHKCKTIYPLDVIEKKRNEEERQRKEEAEKAAKLQHNITKENIEKLQNSGNYQLIFNFITRYPNSEGYNQNFYNLKTILANNGFTSTDSELMSVIKEVKYEGELEWVKKRVLHNNPTSSDECIKNYIEVFGTVSETVQKLQLINYLIKILKDNFNYQGDLESDIIRIKDQVSLEKFEKSLTGQASGKRITINEIDRIDGYEFERVLKELFQKMGYQVIHTPLSKDQGADLIVVKFNEKTVIQAKNWQANVTNKGIQEVFTAKEHYKAQRAIVISSSGFTQSARDVAQTTNVILWDRSILSIMLDENPIFLI